jgi:hypothetical protein
MDRATFWAFLSQTHLITLVGQHKKDLNIAIDSTSLASSTTAIPEKLQK